jgi:cytochrome c biogenesis protein CcdA
MRLLAAQRYQLVIHALSFMLSFILVFTALGASVGLIGYAVRDMLPYIQKAYGIILIAFDLHAMGVLTLPFLWREMRMDVRWPHVRGSDHCPIGIRLAAS